MDWLPADLTQDDVETALPSVGGTAMIVSGPYKGRWGKLLERSSSKQQTVVQLSGDLKVVKASFDEVAAYSPPHDMEE